MQGWEKLHLFHAFPLPIIVSKTVKTAGVGVTWVAAPARDWRTVFRMHTSSLFHKSTFDSLTARSGGKGRVSQRYVTYVNVVRCRLKDVELSSRVLLEFIASCSSQPVTRGVSCITPKLLLTRLDCFYSSVVGGRTTPWTHWVQVFEYV